MAIARTFYGAMTLRTAVTTLMLLAPHDRAQAAIHRVRDDVRLAQSEIAGLASHWGIEPSGDLRSPRPARDRHWPGIVRGMVREAPLPALMVGGVVARR